jgi:hypothetical protein
MGEIPKRSCPWLEVSDTGRERADSFYDAGLVHAGRDGGGAGRCRGAKSSRTLTRPRTASRFFGGCVSPPRGQLQRNQPPHFFWRGGQRGRPRPRPSRPIEVCRRRRALRLTTPGVVRPMSHRDRRVPRAFDETMDRYPKLLELLAIGLPPPARRTREGYFVDQFADSHTNLAKATGWTCLAANRVSSRARHARQLYIERELCHKHTSVCV